MIKLWGGVKKVREEKEKNSKTQPSLIFIDFANE